MSEDRAQMVMREALVSAKPYCWCGRPGKRAPSTRKRSRITRIADSHSGE